MAPLLPDHFDSPILSTLIHVHNLAVSVGDDGQLIVIAVPPDVMPPVVFVLSFCLSSITYIIFFITVPLQESRGTFSGIRLL